MPRYKRHRQVARRKKNTEIGHYIQKAILFIEKAIHFTQTQSRTETINTDNLQNNNLKRQWTGNVIDIVEIIYGLDEMKCINNGDIPINEMVMDFSQKYGIEVKDCYSAYTDMKRRKSDSRTYFLDKMRERLNRRMDKDDEK